MYLPTYFCSKERHHMQPVTNGNVTSG